MTLPFSAPAARPATNTRAVRLLAIASLVLVIAALGFRAIAEADTDLPPLRALAEDVREIYTPAQRGETDLWSALRHDSAPVVRGWKLAWLALNGQIDARVLAFGGLAVQLAAVATFFLLLSRDLRTRWLACLGAGAVAAFATPAFAGWHPMTGEVWPAVLVLFSLVHLGLMTREPIRVGWWLGLACGALNAVATSAGLASAGALVLFGCLAARRDGSWRAQRALIVSNSALFIAGIFLVASRSGTVMSLPSEFPTVAAGLWAVLVAAPGIFCAAQWMLGRGAATNRPTLVLVVLWLLVQLAMFAAIGALRGATTIEFLTCGIVLSAAGFIALPANDRAQRTRTLVLLTLWGIVVANAPDRSRTTGEIPPKADSPAIGAWRSALMADALPPRAATEIETDETRALATLIENKRFIAHCLPVSIRPPLALVKDSATSTAFHADATPELSSRDGLPVMGTWPNSGAEITAEFVSQPLTTPFSLIQIRVSGTLRPPQTSLVLRTRDGTEIPPMDSAFSSENRWKRVHFPAPHGPFQIVARATHATTWMAFTAPLETSGGSRLAGKIPRAWPWLLTLGLLVAVGTAATAWVAFARAAVETKATKGTENYLSWRVVPWLAVLGYAAFFSHHLDTAAGPNDSGGYLNSAKVLVSGHLSAAPRVPFAATAGITDITPYLPATFHEKDGRMVPEYPVGFPLEIWAVAKILPLEKAVPVLLLLQLVFGVLLTRALGRAAGLPEGWAWLGAGVVGFSPLYLFEALQPLSDGPALVSVTAAVYWAWTSREKPWHALLAGFTTAFAVMIRPANLLCVFPILICLAGKWRQLAGWILAGIPGALWLAWYQQTLYGNWHTTGYGETDGMFGLGFVWPTLRSYALWLPELFTPLICLAVIAPFLRSIAMRTRLVLTTWVAAFTLFYACYWCTWDTWFNMRFLLPAAPALVVLSLLVLQRAFEKRGLELFGGSKRRDWIASVALVAALFAFLGARHQARRVQYWIDNNHHNAVFARWTQQHLPADAVIFAKATTGALMYYTDFVFIRLDHPAARNPGALWEQLARTGRPIYALTFHWEQREYRPENGHGTGHPGLPGTWDRIGEFWNDDVYLWQLRAPGNPAPARAR